MNHDSASEGLPDDGLNRLTDVLAATNRSRPDIRDQQNRRLKAVKHSDQGRDEQSPHAHCWCLTSDVSHAPVFEERGIEGCEADATDPGVDCQRSDGSVSLTSVALGHGFCAFSPGEIWRRTDSR